MVSSVQVKLRLDLHGCLQLESAVAIEDEVVIEEAPVEAPVEAAAEGEAKPAEGEAATGEGETEAAVEEPEKKKTKKVNSNYTRPNLERIGPTRPMPRAFRHATISDANAAMAYANTPSS